MKDMEFVPPQATAKVGDTVEWINDDFVMHSATAKNAWDIVVAANGKKELTLKDAGTFDYTCRFHPTMKGKLTVEK